MTKNEIYEHLARVYIGKTGGSQEEDPNKKRKKVWSKIALICVLIVGCFYVLTALFSRRPVYSENKISFALSNSAIRIPYNLNEPYPQIKNFAIPIPKVDASKYSQLSFSIRGLEEGFPGIVKVKITNKRNETSFHFVEDVNLKWKRVAIPLNEFDTISDWTSLSDLSFVIEAWNAQKKEGIVLIDDVCFSSS